ncbi:TldD/PmbA family protein [Dethiothermospora halolimnae]|uniref:TldD/PmbA family protein n=1 Tax=Dethiothermospora halolimnae TaxID=3114390 RepID=UPI003CCBED32
MDIRGIIDRLFEKGKSKGLEEMEVFIQRGSEFELMVYKQEIDKYSIADQEGLSFRGIYNGKMGYSYTEKVDETSIDMLIEEAISNAKVIDSDDEEEIFEGSKEYKTIDVYNDNLDKVTQEEKINFAKELENEAFKLDDRVESVNYCLYNDEKSNTIMVNTKGLDLEDKMNIAIGYISVVVKEGNDVKTAGKLITSNNFSKFKPKKLAKEAVEEAISMLNADSIKSDEYEVVLRRDVSANILKAFSPIFSAEKVQKGLSMLKGKLNKKIGNDILTIVDDPFMKAGVGSRSFDGEGVATKYKKIIDKGVLTTYLHNLKTAKKDGVDSTGNALKSSYKSSISIAPTNMYIEKGDITFDNMIKGVDKGILIIDVQGLHSGLNTVSGDFSLSAYGYEILNGKINRPVNQITIAGNYFEMLNDIEEIGDDLEFGMPGSSYIGSPSIKIKKLSVAGK